MFRNSNVLLGITDDNKEIYLPLKSANRHGIIAGATGTGKTVSLKVLAESFSNAGVPVFMADVKGDLSGICTTGGGVEFIENRIGMLGLKDLGFSYDKFPTSFWDIYSIKGMPLRATISDMGPILLARILGLSKVQSDVLSVVFKIADDQNLLLLDTKDLKSMLSYVGEHSSEYSLEYGNMAPSSLAAIQRAIVAMEQEGGEQFFGEPALNIVDWISRDSDGKGLISLLDCTTLINNPTMYSTFMLWMLSELFETMPEVGDLDKPKMVFFFDEAHLLFGNASKELITKIEQVVKLIRSKGVGVYFITQNPSDIPGGILAQLGCRILHGLRAYTPAEQKGLKAAADSFRENPAFKTIDVLQELGTGEALVSVLDEKGIPTIVEKCYILPPQSSTSPITDEKRNQLIKADFLYTKYSQTYDRESAYEILAAAHIKEAQEAAEQKAAAELAKQQAKEAAALERQQAKEAAALEKQREKEILAAEKAAEKERLAQEKARQRIVKNAVSTVGGTVGRELGNAVGKSIGGSFGKRVGGNLGSSLGRGILGSLFK